MTARNVRKSYTHTAKQEYIQNNANIRFDSNRETRGDWAVSSKLLINPTCINVFLKLIYSGNTKEKILFFF